MNNYRNPFGGPESFKQEKGIKTFGTQDALWKIRE